MPAFGDAGVGVKLVTLTPGNAERDLPFINAVYVLFDADTQAPDAIVDGAALTALRTAAVSGLATRYLASADARRLVIFGAGVQARSHLEAMLAVRPIEHVTVVSRTPERAQALVEVARGRGVDAAVGGANDVADADIVCTCTTSDVPLFDGGLLAPGAHVNAVGSYRPTARELDTVAVARAGWSSRRAMRRSPRPGSCASRSTRARSVATTWSPTSRRSCMAPRSARLRRTSRSSSPWGWRSRI